MKRNTKILKKSFYGPLKKKFDRGDFMVGINRKTELFKHKKGQDYMRLPKKNDR